MPTYPRPEDFDSLPGDDPPLQPPTETPPTTESDVTGSVVTPGVGGTNTATAASTSPSTSGIREMVWCQEPWQAVWAVRSDGLLLSFTHMPEHEVFGWARHPMSNAYVESVTSIPSADGSQDELWAIIVRTVNGATKRFVERMTARHTPSSATDAKVYCYLDSALQYVGAATSTLTGLGHLEGEVVSVWSDGAQHADKTVASGSISLDASTTSAWVGVHSSSWFRTMDLAQTPGGGRNNLSAARVGLLNTIGGKAGSSVDRLYDITQRATAALMDAGPVLRQGWAEVVTDHGWIDEAALVVAQVIPAPMTVLAISVDIEVSR